VNPVARKRQARRCKARRTDGRPRKAYAILGGEVCAAHGGSSWRVKLNGIVRHWEPIISGAYDRAYWRWRREVAERLRPGACFLGVGRLAVESGADHCRAADQRAHRDHDR
jgi:hypothetical protein